MIELEVVIGLEVHVQLATESKIFCSCPNLFGQPPNSLVCPVCMGLPGVLPVLNKKAVELALRAALALNCRIKEEIIFERKNYFYPDLPKNYQISQYSNPLGEEGFLTIGSKKIRIKRVHLEEDAGKLIHKEKYSLVDLNRAGVPLIEIVSYPDISSAQEAQDYLKELKLILQYIGVSTCDMEKGFLRCDANISLREKGSSILGTKTELKNMNSFNQVRQALEYEIKRQKNSILQGEKIIQETRLWDDNKKITLTMRTKEEAHDYRYFPEPDLVSFVISKQEVDKQKALIKELPSQKRKRFKENYSLNDKEIEVIISESGLSNFFEETLKYYNYPKKVCNWITGPLLEVLNNKRMSIEEIKLRAINFAELIKMVESRKITNLVAKELLGELIKYDQNPQTLAEERNLLSISEKSELLGLVREAIEENPRAVEDFLRGKDKAIMFLVGWVMRKTRGKANPHILKELIERQIKEEK
ncbi:MAG: Asp-tRNA(Asn)/Glu-tRNA(Gln) amidotransferase subunit GatB [Candidatus Omnitrophica bacterium]|nr:Asp-tRNA(Asn)/Glu-tRNA(Gln) amidotransferase subunit GatB [Candidatus Omnitrophota bacterium]